MFIETQSPICGTTAYFGPAEIGQVDEESKTFFVRISGPGSERNVSCKLAMPYTSRIRPGATVLVAGQHLDDLYAIGLIESEAALEQTADGADRLELTGGALAVAKESGDVLQVFSPQRALLLEYDAAQGKTRIHADSGDMEFVAEKGSIRFRASQGICLDSQQAVQLDSQSEVRLAVHDDIGRRRSLLRLSEQQVQLGTPHFDVATAGLKVQAGDAELTSKTLRARMGTARFMAETLETVLGTVVQSAKNVYATITDLWQLKSGRMRSVAESSIHWKAKNAFMKADEDVKINGEQIHLG